MSDTAESLLAEFDQIGEQLRQLADQIATELARTSRARIAQVDILRPQIMMLLSKLGNLAMRYGQIPGGARSMALTTAMNFYRSQSGYWAECDRLLRMQLPPRPRPFVPQTADEPSLNSAQLDAADALLNVMHFVAKADTQSQKAYDHGCHADIPLAASAFFRAAHTAHRVLLARGRTGGARFLDVGCGNGMKLLSAAPYFEHCDGLEYQDTSVAAAQTLLERAEAARCRVFQQDALTFDGYGDYDVIYFFRPLRDLEVLGNMEDRIIEQAAPGTLLIAPYLDFQRRSSDLGCRRIAGDVFVTGISQEETDALVEDAQYTGLCLPRREPRAPSLWDAIIEISAARGFSILPSGTDYVL